MNIPNAKTGTNERVRLNISILFDKALTEIYSTIGCADLALKPILAYKLSSVKAAPTTLSEDSHWDSLVEEVKLAG